MTTPNAERRQVHLVELTALPDVRYSVTLGYLEAAARSDPGLDASCDFRKHVHYQQANGFNAVCDQVLADLNDPLVVAFTVYFWNRGQSLELARRIKQNWPDCVILIGGNDVTNEQAAVFAEAPHVDVLVHGEGELRFREILRQLRGGEPDLSGIQGITYWSSDDEDRRLITTRPADRIVDLDEVPSPLLTDVYSDADLAGSRMIVYETNRGCPYSCAFCYWGGATKSKVRQFPLERVYAEIERIVRVCAPGTTLFVADANFGIIGRDVEIAQYLVDQCAKHNKKLLVMTNWAKNTSQRVLEIATLLHRAGLSGAITLSAQSFDQEVLQIANRSNIRLENYRRLQAQFREREIPTYTDLIWGLPGESRDSYLNGIEEVLTAGGSPVVYPLLLLNNTDYTKAKFRDDHSLVARTMRADVGNPDLIAEVVVGHSKMSFDDWLWGMELRVSLTLFQKALLRCTLYYLHSVSGVRLVDIVELLRGYLTDGCSDETVRAIARNFTDAWRDPERFDTELVRGKLNGWVIAEELHYQAILQHIVEDPARMYALTREAVDYCYDRLTGVPLPDRALLDAITSVDLAGTAVFRTAIRQVPQRSTFGLPSEQLAILQDSGCLPASIGRPAGDRIRGTLTVPAARARYPFSAYSLSVWHGSGSPLRDASIVLDRSPLESDARTSEFVRTVAP
jgi:radical SAM superfamily enzyme YgiQ (UPF0313 family)